MMEPGRAAATKETVIILLAGDNNKELLSKYQNRQRMDLEVHQLHFRPVMAHDEYHDEGRSSLVT